MFRRLFWFGLGVAVGVYGTAWMKRKAAEIGERLTLASALQVVTDVSKFLIDKLLELWKKDADVAMKPQDGLPQS